MKITFDMTLAEFPAWSGGIDTQKTLTLTQLDELTQILDDDCYADNRTDTDINDFLWFGRDDIADMLGFADWEELEAHNKQEREG